MHCLYQWLVWPILTVFALIIAHLIGWYQIDLQYSGFAEWLSFSINEVADTSGQPMLKLPLTYRQMVWLYCILVFLSPIILWLVTLGQELAWRGWLFSKLMILGAKRAILISSLVWGFWYAPLILLGHRYPENPNLGVLLTIVFCLIIGALLSWSRLQSNSIWPSVIGHSVILASFPIAHLFHHIGTEVHPELVGLTGLSGWFLPILLILFLNKKNQFEPLKPFVEQRR